MVTGGRQYRVLGAVGRGGFGTVYRAELLGEGGFTKLVALKVLNPDMADIADVAGRLRDEARVLGLLRHRAIVHVDGLAMLDGRWAVVMEYVQGADLERVIGVEGVVPLGPALAIVEEAAGGLHAAYTQTGPEGRALRLLHRDIKPANIQLTTAGETKLLDFGIARADFGAREANTRSVMFGSLAYMAPERLDNVNGPGGDVYALGSVLYELLGGVPFGRTSSKEQRHARQLAAGLDHLRAENIPEAAVAFVGELLAYEPEGRPTARDVERRCGELRAGLRGPTLRDWAESVVPGLLAERVDLPDDLSGSILVEHAGGNEPRRTERAPHVERAAPPRLGTLRTTVPSSGASGPLVRAGAVALVGGLALVGALAAALVIGAWAYTRTDATRPAPVATAPPASPDPPPAPAPEVPAEAAVPDTPPDPAPPPASAPLQVARTGRAKTEGESASGRAAESATASAEEPGADPPSTETAAPRLPAASARVTVVGDARAVWLVAGDKRFEPGDVPPGSYTVEASFGDGALIVAGKVQLLAGGTTLLTCKSAFTRCSATGP